MRRRLHPEQWQVLRRLAAANCPVDCEHQPGAPYPCRVSTEDSPWGTDIFPLPQGTGIAFRLNIVATASFNIGKLDLRADWLKGTIAWSKPCLDHFRSYCFDECIYGPDIRFSFDEALNGKINRWESLDRGRRFRGFLVGSFPDGLPSTAGVKLPATVVIEDLLGEAYPFAIEISNRKGMTRPRSSLAEGGEVI